VIASWKKGLAQMKRIAAQLRTIGVQLIALVSNPKFARERGWVPRTTLLVLEKRRGYN